MTKQKLISHHWRHGSQKLILHFMTVICGAVNVKGLKGLMVSNVYVKMWSVFNVLLFVNTT